jgi:cell division protein FtsB
MDSAHSHARRTRAPRDAARPRQRPRRIATKTTAARIRWDRVGRVALLVAFCVVLGIWVQDGLQWIRAKQASDAQQAIVARLSRDNAALQRQERSLQNPATIERDARALGMVQAGERPYVVTGLAAGSH